MADKKPPPTTFSVRNDPDLEDAFTRLGFDADNGNRSALFKAALLFYAAHHENDKPRSPVNDAKVYLINDPDTNTYVIQLPRTQP